MIDAKWSAQPLPAESPASPDPHQPRTVPIVLRRRQLVEAGSFSVCDFVPPVGRTNSLRTLCRRSGGPPGA